MLLQAVRFTTQVRLCGSNYLVLTVQKTLFAIDIMAWEDVQDFRSHTTYTGVSSLHFQEGGHSSHQPVLYYSREDKGDYYVIRNISRLLGDLTKHNGERFYCYSCLHRFSQESLLKDHLPYCNEHTPQASSC
ncbi:hypothetical protein AVEN_274498-1 [Araneus ventricosus]|uniref:C2H2-type domain-containing protein n=1 Tax=Araneus ventricosus TaxID=182803 RepID=A0A4Y2V668_ARAVE|nr:hypothetical protein AVEN_274498-1 [Araneus ventricosus]